MQIQFINNRLLDTYIMNDKHKTEYANFTSAVTLEKLHLKYLPPPPPAPTMTLATYLDVFENKKKEIR